MARVGCYKFLLSFKSNFGIFALLGMASVVTGCNGMGTNEGEIYKTSSQMNNGALPPPSTTRVGDNGTRRAVVDFNYIKTNILDAACMRCHKEFATEAGLSDLVTRHNPATSSLYTRTADRSMPPRGNPLSAAQLEAIAAYINDLP